MALKLQEATLGRDEAHAAISDQNKGTIGSLAEEARHFTGQRHRRNYSLTQRMRTALNIEDLEEQAQVAWEKGDDKGRESLTNKANTLRTQNASWLKFSEGHNISKLELTQARLDEYFTAVTGMAKEMLKAHQT
jgi:hypothetical protein